MADDKTVVVARKPEEIHTCPVCGSGNALEALQRREYRCGKCNLELAHLDYAPNGTLRSVFGWLLAVGDVVLDRYQIKSVLGKGGFGAAYLVDDLQLSGKRRALKEVPEMMFDEYETSLLSRLDHPAIPDIIERRVANGMVYLSLKFGGSRTLGSERKQYPNRRIPQAKLFPWMRQLCEVLVYLHSQSPPIIHRDLKPDNILLNDDERIMLVDFGIAKESVPEAMTRTLGRAATYGFSPPEQVMGTGTDERSDIYALGATFYALLTGQNPPPAHERVAGTELAPPSQFAADVPAEVEEAIIQSLNLNMNQRQRSVREFAMALGGVEGSPVFGPPGAGATHPGQASASATRGNRTHPAAPAQDAAVSPRKGAVQPTSQSPATLALAGIAVALAAIATGAYFYFTKPSADGVARSAPASIVPPVPAEHTAPAASPASSAPVAPPPPASVVTPNPPQEPPPVSLPQSTQPAVTTPSSPAIAAPTVTPKEEDGSAPKDRSLEQPSKAQTKDRSVSALPPPAKPKSTQVPKAHPAAPAEQVMRPATNHPLLRELARRRLESAERISPKPSGGPAPSWSIIPGGAHKTD